MGWKEFCEFMDKPCFMIEIETNDKERELLEENKKLKGILKEKIKVIDHKDYKLLE